MRKELEETIFIIFFKTPFGGFERVASRITLAGAIGIRDQMVKEHLYKPEELEIHEVTTITRWIDV